MTTRQFDLYAALGVSPDATHDEIVRAYRARLRQYHPDTREAANGAQSATSDAALQQILVAYTTLRDTARRADYDRKHRRRVPQPRQPEHLEHPHSDTRQAPIVAGPVRWHRNREIPP